MRGRDWSFVAAVAAAGFILSWPQLRKTRSRKAPEEAVEQVTAVQMAREAGVDARAFRAALRAANLSWHDTSAPWTVDRDSPEHRDMITVLEELRAR